jgi:hypothetical protein
MMIATPKILVGHGRQSAVGERPDIAVHGPAMQALQIGHVPGREEASAPDLPSPATREVADKPARTRTLRDGRSRARTTPALPLGVSIVKGTALSADRPSSRIARQRWRLTAGG